ncbi:MAG TPA: hypothetical protein VMF67_02395 [Rhizomicrobium sp.]|nr:hypothetical protein [Rhizomicrobium sp.]
MAKVRSPNYPNHNLGAALELVRKVFAKDGRNKVARLAVAKHLGHEGLSGPALGKIGALRAYGLMEGAGDELRVSDDAIAALMAPESSKERKEALERLALKPVLFQDIHNEYPSPPSADNLAYWLIQQGFSPTAATIAANSYLETIALVGGLSPSYSPPAEGGNRAGLNPPPHPPLDDKKGQAVKIMDGERVAFTEEMRPGQYLKVIASGEVDDFLLDALDDFVKRQRKLREILKRPAGHAKRPEGIFEPGDTIPASGNYWRIHPNDHAENEKMVLAAGDKFRTCPTCGNEAYYKQVQIGE